MKFVLAIHYKESENTYYPIYLIGPDSIAHTQLADSIRAMVEQSWPGNELEIISAGGIGDDYMTFGHSTSLGLRSVGRDRQLMRNTTYQTFGIPLEDIRNWYSNNKFKTFKD